MTETRAIEHYRDHEMVCTANVTPHGWTYTLSVVRHIGDRDTVSREESKADYHSGLEALAAARARGRELIDNLHDAPDD